ncbi:MAG: hypothetical protein P4L53_19885 [Candidatus Obscuribacterales bacterium]|nr:hypothetical protein [Candidatus Obscuribacterales bacterium]
MLRIKSYFAQTVVLSIISTISFCGDAQAMLMPDALDAAVQKKSNGLKEFAHSSTVNSTRDKNQWLQIPAWLAGTWCSSDTIEVHPDKTAANGKNISVNLKLIAFYKIGTAKDLKGRIWQYVSVPPESVPIGGLVEERTLQHCEIVNVGPNIIEIRTVFRVQENDARTGVCYGDIIERSNVTHKYLSPNHMLTSVVLSDYDCEGHLLDSFSKSCLEIRVKPFQSSTLGELQQSFDEFINQLNQNRNNR